MRLLIKRGQVEQKGVFGGHKGMKFSLSCRIELDPDEQALVQKYRAEKHPLLYGTINDTEVPSVRVEDLVQGVSHEVDHVTALLSYEDKVRDACRGFKLLLGVMASFGGEQVVEFTDESVQDDS